MHDSNAAPNGQVERPGEPDAARALALAVLKNSGIDVTCAACVEVAFTGATTGVHSCRAADENTALRERVVKLEAAAKAVTQHAMPAHGETRLDTVPRLHIDALRAALDGTAHSAEDDSTAQPDGREAEELRSGIEALIDMASSHEEPECIHVDRLQALLDRVDARDSLAFLSRHGAEVRRLNRAVGHALDMFDAKSLDCQAARAECERLRADVQRENAAANDALRERDEARARAENVERERDKARAERDEITHIHEIGMRNWEQVMGEVVQERNEARAVIDRVWEVCAQVHEEAVEDSTVALAAGVLDIIDEDGDENA